jgi:hypothetical protein
LTYDDSATTYNLFVASTPDNNGYAVTIARTRPLPLSFSHAHAVTQPSIRHLTVTRSSPSLQLALTGPIADAPTTQWAAQKPQPQLQQRS